MTEIKQKDLTIETLRGIAILLVVIGHVIGSAPDGGMRIPFPSPWRYLYSWIDYIQMPLFTAIAGWVYAYKPIRDKKIPIFLFDKCKRLLLPMATVATLYFLLQYIIPGTNSKSELSQIWRIYFFPYTIFWYLQSLFLIFTTIAICDKYQFFSTVKKTILGITAAYLLYIIEINIIPHSIPDLFSFRGALSQLPYFMIGLLIQRFGKKYHSSYLNAVWITLTVIGIGLLQFKWIDPTLNILLYKSLLPLWLLGTLLLLFKLSINNKVFVYLGSYAYSIYLFHGFGTSGGRIIISSLGVHSQIIIFLFATIIAIIAPIVVDKILSCNRFTRLLFLGKK